MTLFWKVVVSGACIAVLCATSVVWWVRRERAIKLAASVEEVRAHAERGDADAEFRLARSYYKGTGVPQDYGEAVRWYRKAAEQGFAKAQFNLGQMYHFGEGVQRDYAEASQWYRKAAEQGDPRAESALGYAYLNGKGVPQDAAEGALRYRKAAEQGYALAQQALGYLYATGKGVQQDDTEALVWYRRAAAQGDAEAQQCLGYMYAYGRGVQKDRFEAVRWYRMAAKQGDPQAVHMLGLLKTRSSVTRNVEYVWVLIGFPVGVWFLLDFLIPRRKRLNSRQTAVTLLGLIFLLGACLSLYAITHDDMQYSRWDITFRVSREVLALVALFVGIFIIWSPKKTQKLQP